MNTEDDLAIFESSFCDRLCDTVHEVLILKFPRIKNLSVQLDNDFEVNVIFDETEYTSEEVSAYLQELRKVGLKLNS